jgi:hypothetical protein
MFIQKNNLQRFIRKRTKIFIKLKVKIIQPLMF